MLGTVDARPQAPLARSLVEQISAALDEPAWLRERRLAWWDRYEATPFPSGQEEEWRRTSLKDLPLDAQPLVPGQAGPTATGNATRPEPTDLPGAAGTLRLAGGQPVEATLDAELAERGVLFTDLRTAVSERPELVQRYLGTADSLPSHAKFWSLAHAAWSGGTFLYVPASVEIRDPLLAADVVGGGVAHLPQTLVVAEPYSRVTLVEDRWSPDGADPSWVAGAVDIRAAEGARVRYVSLQRLGDTAWNVGFQRAVVGQSAEVTTLNVETGSRVTKLGAEALMTGNGGTSHLLGLIAAGAEQRIDINSHQDLVASHTTSDLLYLSALYGSAKAAFYGIIRVRPGAVQTSSYQECRNLLLSPNAGAEPIPVLEIECNDILRCGHGATAGAIDPTQLFYAQSRGLDADSAERMIVRGFFEQVISRLPEEAVRELALRALAPRIGTADLDEVGELAA